MAAKRFFLRGEIDLSNAPQLHSDLVDLVGAGNEDVIIDCVELTFIDSAGIAVIVRTQKALDARGNELRVANVDATSARVLEILGLTELLHVNEPESAPRV